MCLIWLFKHCHEDVKGLKSIACFQNVICSTWSEVSTHKHGSIERGNCFNNITVIFHNILYFGTNGNLRNAAIILVLNIATFKWSFIFQNIFNSIKICTDLHHRELSPMDAMNKQTYLCLPLLGWLHPFSLAVPFSLKPSTCITVTSEFETLTTQVYCHKSEIN